MIRFLSADNGSKTIISIAGKLEEESLAELEALCADARPTVVFDLSDLQGADEASVRWLRARVEKGDRVTGATPYIGLRLDRESAPTTSTKRPKTEEP